MSMSKNIGRSLNASKTINFVERGFHEPKARKIARVNFLQNIPFLAGVEFVRKARIPRGKRRGKSLRNQNFPFKVGQI